MRKRFWWGLLFVTVGAPGALAQTLAVDHFDLLLPELSVRPLHEFDELACSALFPDPQNSFLCNPPGSGTDSTGSRYETARRLIPRVNPLCPSQDASVAEIFEVERITNVGVEVIARVPKCLNQSDGRRLGTLVLGIGVDPVNGFIDLAVRQDLGSDSTRGIIRISGLPTLFDIIPTFQPASETLSWITPKHPEALPAADNFHVYVGSIDDLRRDRDFSSAVPIDCMVPDIGPPAQGEYLSILDPLNPANGKVEYAIVGAELQGTLRFGRQSMGGILSGRSTAQFGSCV